MLRSSVGKWVIRLATEENACHQNVRHGSLVSEEFVQNYPSLELYKGEIGMQLGLVGSTQYEI